MGNTRSFEHSSIDWLAKEPLAPHIDAYMLYLANRGYAATTFSHCLGSVSHFAQFRGFLAWRSRRATPAERAGADTATGRLKSLLD